MRYTKILDVMRGMDLIEVARQCPDLTVSIRLGDLIEANQSLVEEALMRLEKSVAESRTEIYLSRTKVMEMLEVASAPYGGGRNVATSYRYPSAARNATVCPTSNGS